MSHYSDKHYTASHDFDKFYYGIFFKKGDKILDIGCSTGNFIAQDPKNITGIDIDKDAIKMAKKRGLSAICHDITKRLPFKKNSIENVNCRHVLEHLEDPMDFMMEIHRILKKNGRLILITDKYSKHFWDDYTHKRPFTKRSLEQMTYDAGFRKYHVYDFPSKGVFGAGFLHKHKMISPKTLSKLYRIAGKIFKHYGILLEAVK